MSFLLVLAAFPLVVPAHGRYGVGRETPGMGSTQGVVQRTAARTHVFHMGRRFANAGDGRLVARLLGFGAVVDNPTLTAICISAGAAGAAAVIGAVGTRPVGD